MTHKEKQLVVIGALIFLLFIIASNSPPSPPSLPSEPLLPIFQVPSPPPGGYTLTGVPIWYVVGDKVQWASMDREWCIYQVDLRDSYIPYYLVHHSTREFSDFTIGQPDLLPKDTHFRGRC